MNKAIIRVWVGTDGQQKLEEIGYINGQEIDYKKIFKIAKDIFEGGLNIMIFNNDDRIILAVDTRRFQQR
jgi:hypothetical protein